MRCATFPRSPLWSSWLGWVRAVQNLGGRRVLPLNEVCGENFRFGYKAKGTASTLQDLGRPEKSMRYVFKRTPHCCSYMEKREKEREFIPFKSSSNSKCLRLLLECSIIRYGVLEETKLTFGPSRSYGLKVAVVPLQQRAGVVSSSRIRDSVDVESRRSKVRRFLLERWKKWNGC